MCGGKKGVALNQTCTAKMYPFFAIFGLQACHIGIYMGRDITAYNFYFWKTRFEKDGTFLIRKLAKTLFCVPIYPIPCDQRQQIEE
jgi:hypothetical protein